MMWAALYQQRPAPEEGDYFKVDWLKSCDELPPKDTMRFYGASDYAVTADGGDPLPSERPRTGSKVVQPKPWEPCLTIAGRGGVRGGSPLPPLFYGFFGDNSSGNFAILAATLRPSSQVSTLATCAFFASSRQ